MEIFIELTGIIVITTVFAVFMRLFKQPLIVGYILAGVLVGPHFLHILHAKEQIELFSKIGITILLFILGLNLNPKVIKELGNVSLVIGVGQVIITSVIGFVIALFLGIDKIAAIYISIALTFSSTIIILKLLSDKGDVHKLYGKLSIGVLLVQDIIATIILLFISSFAGNNETSLITLIAIILFKGIALLYILYLIVAHILPRFTRFIASSQELLFLFSITWGFSLATIFYLLGFSIEIGALIAGVTLSVTPYADGVASRLRPLRDFFIVLFFILLGSEMALDNISQILLPALVLSVFVLIGNPVIVIILMNLLGFKRRTAFQAGMTIAQISEFSLILATLGYNVGHLDKGVLSLVTLVALITIAGSTYLILYSDRIYPHVEKLLKLLEFRKGKRDLGSGDVRHDLILFGFDRVGRDFIHSFKKLEKNYLVVDFNPAIIQRMQEESIPFRFGDAEDVEFLHELNFENVKLCVSTIPTFKTNALIIKMVRRVNANAIIVVLSHDVKEAKELYELGATYVIMSHYLGARYASNMIARLGLDREAFKEEKEKHLEHLERIGKFQY